MGLLNVETPKTDDWSVNKCLFNMALSFKKEKKSFEKLVYANVKLNWH